MDQRLKDRVALVTGAGRGIGQAIAGRLAREGASVWLADIDEPEARAALAGAIEPVLRRLAGAGLLAA